MEINPGTHVGVGDGVVEAVGEYDSVIVGVTLPPLCGQPPSGSGVPAGLVLADGFGSTTPTRSPLAAKLLGAVALKLA